MQTQAEVKMCPKCGRAKPLAEFHRSMASVDGRCCYCIPCTLAGQRESKARSARATREIMARFAAAAATLAFVVAAAPARAESPPVPLCMPREALVADLTGRYGETVTGRGLNAPTQVLEIWTSPAGTWTAVVFGPSGTSCIVAEGQGWEAVAQPAQGRGA